MVFRIRIPVRTLQHWAKYEVTNEEFKEFVDDGGYRENPSYWDGITFERDEVELSNFEASDCS